MLYNKISGVLLAIFIAEIAHSTLEKWYFRLQTTNKRWSVCVESRNLYYLQRNRFKN